MLALAAATALLATQFQAPQIPAPTGDLRIMVWNVLYGGSEVDQGPEKAKAWIQAAKPDIVLMQESYDIEGPRPSLGPWIAAELGWNHHQGSSPHLCVFTPHPVEKTYFHAAWHALGAHIKTPKGDLVAYSIWIDSDAYTPYELRDKPNATDEELLACETTKSERFPQAQAILQHLKDQNHLAANLPLLVGGDWNCPSHLDWTEDAAKIYRFRRPLPLPVSTMMINNGFQDAYRLVHPDPVNQPGITWSPLDRGTLELPETADRIDRLYLHKAKAPKSLQPVQAFTLPQSPEPNSRPKKDREFPSDHAAVIIDLAWQTAP